MGFTAGGGGSNNVVDLYNSASGTWSTARLSVGRPYLAATSVGNVAIFAGGSYSDAVDLYNSASGTWSTAQLTNGADERERVIATSVGNVAIFAGGSVGNCSFALCDGGLVLELFCADDACLRRVLC